jgi:hypothetical protein
VYKINVDEQTGVLLVKFTGFMSDGEQADYEREFALMQARARSLAGRLLLLIDALEASVLSSSVATKVGAMQARFIEPANDKVAMVHASALLTLQSNRLYVDERSRVFSSEASAMEWLLAD